jgi:catechol 2,3-dioxygenase-like lactoylglutathione lyase family enzyme
MEYTQYMPGSLHSKDIGQHLGPNRIATEMTRVTLAVDDVPKATAFYKDKVGFALFGVPSAQSTLFKLPAGASASIQLVPSAKLGHKAEITVDADLTKATATLKFAGQTVDNGVVTDPDGNRIIFSR